MSGPKVSVYTLTAQQRAIIAEERRRRLEEEKKRKTIQKKVKNKLIEIDAFCEQIKEFDFVASTTLEYLQDKALIDEQKSIMNCALESHRKLSAIANSNNSKTMETVLSQEVEELLSLDKRVKALAKKAEVARGSLQETLRGTAKDLFSSPAENSADTKNASRISGQNLITTLVELERNPNLPANLLYEVASMRKRYETFDIVPDGFYALEVQPVVRRCELFITQWNEYGEEYEQLMTKYELLLECRHARDSMKLFPFSPEAIEQLKMEIELEEALVQEQSEQEYINESINEVMEELGYSVWGHREVTKRNGTHFKNSLFHYSDGTAISVTCSDSGQICMEIGGVDTKDRLPSKSECDLLKSQMVKFCDDYATIEDRLAKKGVYLKNRIRLSPPSSEYAQIINACDYEITLKADGNKKAQRKVNPKQMIRQED